jgi:HEPN domain-containing protein
LKRIRKNNSHKFLTWVEFANEDLRIAELAFKLSSNVPYRIIAFHSQQCAEKFLKAFMVYHKIDFPYTHNISTLIELLIPVVDLNKKLLQAKELSKYAVAVRYPTDYLKISRSEALRTVRIAKRVKIIITDLLIREGINL